RRGRAEAAPPFDAGVARLPRGPIRRGRARDRRGARLVQGWIAHRGPHERAARSLLRHGVAEAGRPEDRDLADHDRSAGQAHHAGMSPPTPAQLGNFEIRRRLGAGGMAEMFVAEKRGAANTSKVLVVKRILPEYAAQRRFRDMFVEEAQLAT